LEVFQQEGAVITWILSKKLVGTTEKHPNQMNKDKEVEQRDEHATRVT
jgi:hypothetical protein